MVGGFRTNGNCVDEAKTDPSLAKQYDFKNRFWVRRVKHFSGYNVVFGTDGGFGGMR